MTELPNHLGLQAHLEHLLGEAETQTGGSNANGDRGGPSEQQDESGELQEGPRPSGVDG